MKKVGTGLLIAAVVATMALASRFESMSTDELLDLRGKVTTSQERTELHEELTKRYETMSEEQKQKFNQRPPEGRTPKYQRMQDGGSGQGMGRGAGPRGMRD